MRHDSDCAFPPPCPFGDQFNQLTHAVNRVQDDLWAIRDVLVIHGKQLLAAATGIDATGKILTRHMEREEELLDSMASRLAFQLRELQRLDGAAKDLTMDAVGEVLTVQEKRISRAVYVVAAIAAVNAIAIGGVLVFHGLRFWGLA